jgi:hypothetical protein
VLEYAGLPFSVYESGTLQIEAIASDNTCEEANANSGDSIDADMFYNYDYNASLHNIHVAKRTFLEIDFATEKFPGNFSRNAEIVCGFIF